MGWLPPDTELPPDSQGGTATKTATPPPRWLPPDTEYTPEPTPKPDITPETTAAASERFPDLSGISPAPTAWQKFTNLFSGPVAEAGAAQPSGAELTAAGEKAAPAISKIWETQLYQPPRVKAGQLGPQPGLLPPGLEQRPTTAFDAATINTLKGFAGGLTSARGLVGLLPPVAWAQTAYSAPGLWRQVQEAEKTPPWSQERWEAGLAVVTTIGTLGLLSKAAVAGLRAGGAQFIKESMAPRPVEKPPTPPSPTTPPGVTTPPVPEMPPTAPAAEAAPAGAPPAEAPAAAPAAPAPAAAPETPEQATARYNDAYDRAAIVHGEGYPDRVTSQNLHLSHGELADLLEARVNEVPEEVRNKSLESGIPAVQWERAGKLGIGLRKQILTERLARLQAGNPRIGDNFGLPDVNADPLEEGGFVVRIGPSRGTVVEAIEGTNKTRFVPQEIPGGTFYLDQPGGKLEPYASYLRRTEEMGFRGEGGDLGTKAPLRHTGEAPEAPPQQEPVPTGKRPVAPKTQAAAPKFVVRETPLGAVIRNMETGEMVQEFKTAEQRPTTEQLIDQRESARARAEELNEALKEAGKTAGEHAVQATQEELERREAERIAGIRGLLTKLERGQISHDEYAREHERLLGEEPAPKTEPTAATVPRSGTPSREEIGDRGEQARRARMAEQGLAGQGGGPRRPAPVGGGGTVPRPGIEPKTEPTRELEPGESASTKENFKSVGGVLTHKDTGLTIRRNPEGNWEVKSADGELLDVFAGKKHDGRKNAVISYASGTQAYTVRKPIPPSASQKTPPRFARTPPKSRQAIMQQTIRDAFESRKDNAGTGEIGLGMSSRDLIDGGRDAIRAGVNPEEVARSSDIRPDLGYGVVRGHAEDLRDQAARLYNTSKDKPTPENQAAAEEAFLKYKDWDQDWVVTSRNAARNFLVDKGQLPLEPDYNINNMVDLREQFWRDNNRDMTPAERGRAEKIMDEILTNNEESRKLLDQRSDELAKASPHAAIDWRDNDAIREGVHKILQSLGPC